MPFVGHIGAETVSYREHLFRVSLDVIQLNPIFGSPNFLMQMEELRTGEGIIDLVNAYLAFALAYGLVGLGLFVGFMRVASPICSPAVSEVGSCQRNHMSDRREFASAPS